MNRHWEIPETYKEDFTSERKTNLTNSEIDSKQSWLEVDLRKHKHTQYLWMVVSKYLIKMTYKEKVRFLKKNDIRKKENNYWWQIVARYLTIHYYQDKINSLENNVLGKSSSNSDTILWWWIVAKYQLKVSGKGKSYQTQMRSFKNLTRKPAIKQEVNLWWWIVASYLKIVVSKSQKVKPIYSK